MVYCPLLMRPDRPLRPPVGPPDLLPARAGHSRLLLAAYGLCTLFAALVYIDGLDSQHIPKNGDEYPYEHITRVTAGSGRLLPLRSELPELRNTKPPLLFWQGIASTGWGRRWTLWDLRWPSVVYTLLTAALVFAVGFRLSRRAETGLRAALEWQIREFQKRTKIECQFDSNVDELHLDAERSTALFRILQETLTNVARHAQATRVEGSLQEQEHHLILTVHDNGTGISEEQISGTHRLGLLGMRERAHIFGGEVVLDGAPGEGTTVTVRIPV